MKVRKIPSWQHEPCHECGQEFLFTRADPKEVPANEKILCCCCAAREDERKARDGEGITFHDEQEASLWAGVVPVLIASNYSEEKDTICRMADVYVIEFRKRWPDE